MIDRRGPFPVWAVGLWAALLAGILVAWSPRYWAVSVAIVSVAIVTVGWIIFSLVIQVRSNPNGFELPLQTILVVPIGAWGFLQMAFHTTVLPQLTLESSLVWALGAGAFILGSQILRARAARKLFLDLMLWSLTALAVIAMFQFYDTPVRVFGIFPAVDGVTGTFLNRNQFAALMELAAPIALWSMLERSLVIGGLCYAMILAAAITAASRAGIVLVGVELLVFLSFVLFSRRRQARAIVSILGGLALIVAVAWIVAGTDRIASRLEDKNPEAVRGELRASTMKLIAERPWFGHGMGTWRAIYPRVATFDEAVLANEAHDDWAQWASDGGIPFSFLILALVLWIFKPAAQSIWGLGVLSVMVHSYVDFPIREPALLFLWFSLAGAVTQFDARKPSPARSRVDG